MITRVIENKSLGNAFVLSLERKDIDFVPGMHTVINIPGNPNKRPYSIYSATYDPYIELLIKEIKDGVCTPLFKELKPGDELEISKPDGVFIIDKNQLNKKFIFVATGSGIAPFRSFTRSFRPMNYELYHGVKTRDEMYQHNEYANYFPCVSREPSNEHYNGRVTDYFLNTRICGKIDKDAIYYLCGLGEMIYEMDSLLTEAGVPSENIHWEIYHAHRI